MWGERGPSLTVTQHYAAGQDVGGERERKKKGGGDEEREEIQDRELWGEKFVLFYAGMAFLSATSACLNTLYYFCGGNP